LRKLEQAGFRSALIEAVIAAAQRSKELGSWERAEEISARSQSQLPT
jgi:hypothetical protein